MKRAPRIVFAALIFAATFANSSAAASQDSAYPPQYASIKTVQAWIPMKDGVRLAVNLYMPDGPRATAHQDEKFPGDPRILALPQRRLDSGARLGPAFLFRAPRLRHRARGYSRHRRERRKSARPRILRSGAARWPGSDRVACETAVVERQRGHDGNFLGRFQFHPDRAAASARAESHHRRCAPPRNYFTTTSITLTTSCTWTNSSWAWTCNSDSRARRIFPRTKNRSPRVSTPSPGLFSTCTISATANSGAALPSRRIITTNTKFRLS